MSGLLRRLRERQAGDEGAALILAVLMIFMVATLSLAVAGITLTQSKPTQVDRKLIRTVHAAEAGFDVALNRIRSAQNSGIGVLSSLPCNIKVNTSTVNNGAKFTGNVSANDGNEVYVVYVRYFASSPTGQTEAWRNTNSIKCATNGPTTQPAYALLQSEGDAADVRATAMDTGNRSLETTYQFSIKSVNVSGGLIRLYNETTNLCLAAASGSSGAKLIIKTCNADDPLQEWSYTDSPALLLKLVNYNLCAEASYPTAPAKAWVTLASCNSGKANQTWNFNDNGRFEGSTGPVPTGDLNGWWMTVDSIDCNYTPSNGSGIVMRNGSAKIACSPDKVAVPGGYNQVATFSPNADVGAGPAGDATNQLVNYRFFGRCFDVTNQNKDYAWMIGYPCKQAPDPAKIRWNQTIVYDSVRTKFCTDVSDATISTSLMCGQRANLYCLQAGTSTTPATAGTRVLLKTCLNGDPSQVWLRTQNSGSYASSYNVVTSNGLCMTLQVPGPTTDTYLAQWGYITTETCKGSTAQKWNAPPQTLNALVRDMQEKRGG